MSVEVSRAARVRRNLVLVAVGLVLASVIVEIIVFVSVRSAAVALRSQVTGLTKYIPAEVDRLVADAVSSALLTCRVSVADSTASGSTGGSTAVDRANPNVRFISCPAFSTWESPSGVPMARISGIDCSVGDFIEHGLVLSIRRGRVICKSIDDDALVIVAASASPPPPPAALGTSVAGGGGGVESPQM